jgi:hypothetical protein
MLKRTLYFRLSYRVNVRSRQVGKWVPEGLVLGRSGPRWEKGRYIRGTEAIARDYRKIRSKAGRKLGNGLQDLNSAIFPGFAAYPVATLAAQLQRIFSDRGFKLTDQLLG